MALMYLLDTNTISEVEKVPPNPYVVAQLNQHHRQIGLAAISWHEILYGYHRLPESKRKQRIQNFITRTISSRIPILAYDAAAAKWFAIERARLTGIGRTPSYSDGQIAAIADTNNLTLVTRNVADFSDFNGLTIENWFEG